MISAKAVTEKEAKAKKRKSKLPAFESKSSGEEVEVHHTHQAYAGNGLVA